MRATTPTIFSHFFFKTLQVHVFCSWSENMHVSSNGRHSGLKIFKPEKNLEFFRLKNFEAIDAYPGKLE